MVKIRKNIKVKLTPKQKCEGRGWIWNETTQTCNPPSGVHQRTAIEKQPTTKRGQIQRQKEQEAIRQAEAKKRERIQKQKLEEDLDKPMFSGKIDTSKTSKTSQKNQDVQPQPVVKKLTPNEKLNARGNIITDKFGNERIQTKEDLQQGKADVLRLADGRLTKEQEALLSQERLRQQQGNQQLLGQVGQFEQLGVNPTGLDYKEALASTIVQSLPKAITYAAGALAVTGGGTNPASIVAGVGTFTGTMVAGISSSFASQRRDITTAQQKVLEEGKQTMKDWVTMAKSDPANKAKYLGEFNKISSQIDQAYRQMKLDVSKDVAKFETALPDLAEFEAFYAEGGERDGLNIEMQNALLTQASSDYELLELAQRRGKLNEQSN